MRYLLFTILLSLPVFAQDMLSQIAITQYSCLSQATGYSSKLHFYFFPRFSPELPSNGFVCHDVLTHGPQDDVLFPRLEQISGVFKAWDSQDERFFDNNGNGMMDIDDLLNVSVRNYGGATRTNSYFMKVNTPSEMVLNQYAGNLGPQTMGMMLKPLVRNKKSYCVTQADVDYGTPEALAVRDYVGVETEGLYVASSSEKDYLYIREYDLKRVWFYVKNGVLTTPTDATVGDVTVYFYYPLNFATPFVKTEGQTLYRLRAAQELTMGTELSLPTHDRKMGCIPKM